MASDVTKFGAGIGPEGVRSHPWRNFLDNLQSNNADAFGLNVRGQSQFTSGIRNVQSGDPAAQFGARMLPQDMHQVQAQPWREFGDDAFQMFTTTTTTQPSTTTTSTTTTSTTTSTTTTSTTTTSTTTTSTTTTRPPTTTTQPPTTTTTTTTSTTTTMPPLTCNDPSASNFGFPLPCLFCPAGTHFDPTANLCVPD